MEHHNVIFDVYLFKFVGIMLPVQWYRWVKWVDQGGGERGRLSIRFW